MPFPTSKINLISVPPAALDVHEGKDCVFHVHHHVFSTQHSFQTVTLVTRTGSAELHLGALLWHNIQHTHISSVAGWRVAPKINVHVQIAGRLLLYLEEGFL